MPTWDTNSHEYRSERESPAATLSEIDAAAAFLMRHSGLSHAQAFAKILEQRPELYAKYRAAKRKDFSGQ